ncbi:MAG: glycosyltransferase [Lachnospiraceae bacterium]|nr:glycosyltransferase [Lachnospiraceae bacterium]
MMFSIIIPIYKVQDYLIKCVDSVCSQTYKDIEIILVDDGSPDSCPLICDEYAKKDSRVKVIHKENGGLSDARNSGFDVASGEYIIFVDSDDFIEIDACEKFARFTEKGYDVLIGDAIVEGGVCDLSHIELDKPVSGTQYYKAALLKQKAPVVAWINAYRREFLKENNLKFKYGILHEDVEFTPRVFLAAQSVIYTNNFFYHYMIRDNSIMRQKDQRKNAVDLFTTCCEHEVRFRKIEDTQLQKLLLDSLVKSYLSLFQGAKLYQYGDEYVHKDFCLRNAYTVKTKLKSALFNFSPQLYWHINAMMKKGA